MSTFTPRQRKLLLGCLRRSPGLFSGLFALGLLAAVLETFGVFTALPLVSALLKASGPALFHWCLILAALVAVRSTALLAHARLCAKASGAAMHEAKTAVLKAYVGASDTTLVDMKAGRLGQILSRGAYSSGAIVLRLPQWAAEIVRAAGLTLVLLWLDFRVALGLALAGAFLWELFGRAFFSVAYAQSQERSAAEAEQNVILNEIFWGARQLKLSGAMDRWRERFARASGAFSRYHSEEMSLQALPKIWFEAGAAAVILGWLLIAMNRGSAQAASGLPLLAAVVVGAGRLLPCLSTIGRCRLEILGALPGAEAMEDFIAGSMDLSSAAAGRRPCQSQRPHLRLEGVRFGYPGRPELLKRLDLDLSPGRFVVLAGPYGCGKTTLLSLLLGLREPSEGQILLDGRPLAEYDRSSWWSRVGVVPQDAFLFHGTISENITLDRPGHAQADVERAAALVGAHDFVASLPLGYDTVVGERGLKLSGGQRQMVTLARALLGGPAVLLFDEPAAGLDPAAQEELAAALRRIARGRTVVVATHQLDWTGWADAAYLLKDGRLTPPAGREARG